MASIGVHVLGGNPNSASIISGPYGNPFDAYVTALKGNLKGSHKTGEATLDGTEANGTEANGAEADGTEANGTDADGTEADGTEANATKAAWLSWITVPTKEQVSGGENDVPTETEAGGVDESIDNPEGTVPSGQPDSESEVEEGFFNFLKKALRVAGPLGMAASVGLNVVGTLVGKKREAAVDEAYSFEGVPERALLGEAALAAVVHLGPSKCKDLGIFKRMQPTVLKLRPIYSRAAPTVMPLVMERAWRMTMAPTTSVPKKKGEAAIKPAVIATSSADTNTLGFGPPLDPNAEAFVRLFTESLTTEDTESFADTEFNIGGIFAKGLRILGPLLGSVAESGISELGGGQAGTEAGVDPDTEADVNNPESSAFTYDAMTQRAIAGEAALGALLQTPVEVLQQESLVSVMKGPLIKYGPKFLKLLNGAATGLGLAAAVKDLTGKKEMQGEAGLDQGDAASSGDKGEVGGDSTTEMDESNFLATLENSF